MSDFNGVNSLASLQSAAAYYISEPERREAIVKYAFDNKCSIIHAASALDGDGRPCSCAPCSKARPAFSAE